MMGSQQLETCTLFLLYVDLGSIAFSSKNVKKVFISPQRHPSDDARVLPGAYHEIQT